MWHFLKISQNQYYSSLDEDLDETVEKPMSKSNKNIPRQISHWCTSKNVLLCALLLSSVITNVFLALRSYPTQTYGPVPLFKTEAIEFQKMSEYQEEPSVASNLLWNSYVSESNMLVELSKTLTDPFNISPGSPSNDPDKRVYGVSWIHQYHCLQMFRKTWFDLLRARREYVTANVTDEYRPEKERALINHVSHCLDYLRQNILCTSDMTLEGESPPDPEFPSRSRINGFGFRHICKKKSEVFQWMQDNRPI